MRLLFLSHTGTTAGGAEQCLLEYIEVLRRQGHECKVVVPHKGSMTTQLDKKGIGYSVIGFGWATIPKKKVNSHKIRASTGNSLVKIFQEVEKYKPHIIFTNTVVIPWGLYAGKAFSIPNVLLVHEIINDKDPSLPMSPSYASYGEILNQCADYVIYNSQFVQNEFSTVLTKPIISKDILYPLPPLDVEKIEAIFKENVIKGKLKVAIFGALSPRKNQLEALQAVKLLYDRGIRNLELDLYGDTLADIKYTKLLRKFIREHSLGQLVKIKGFVSDGYAKMNEYNVLLNAATYEPFGRTIIEGQLFGRIVISDDTGGGLELVRHMQNGIVYRSGDPSELAQKLEWVINHPVEAMSLAHRAKHEQIGKYLVPSRYDALLDAAQYFAEQKKGPQALNIFDPMMSLFQYNHQLNNRYRHLYRLTHNRLTRPVKDTLARTLAKAKITAKRVVR